MSFNTVLIFLIENFEQIHFNIQYIPSWQLHVQS